MSYIKSQKRLLILIDYTMIRTVFGRTFVIKLDTSPIHDDAIRLLINVDESMNSHLLV